MKPTPAQRRVLDAMAAGARLYWEPRNSSYGAHAWLEVCRDGWWDFESSVDIRVFRNLLAKRCVMLAEGQGPYRYKQHTITAAGRAAVEGGGV